MHELSLAEGIVRMVEEAALREHFNQVATLRLECGALAGVQVDALRFALEAIAPDTCLAGAVIEIEEPPGRAWCARCAAEVQIEHRADPCPMCLGYPVKVTAGSALRIIDLVVQNN